MNLPLSTTVNKYDNIMLTGDLNLNTKSNNNSYYSDLCDTFHLTNLIKAKTCFKSSNPTSIDIILTNQRVITTGLSDCHKMILTFFHSYFSRLTPKTITHRRFRYFETKDFLFDLENKLHSKERNRGIEYDDLTNIFRLTLDNHAPQSSSFYDKSKAIMTRSRIRIKNKYNKWPSRENFLALSLSK